jgi:putative DNA primase/helicase
VIIAEGLATALQFSSSARCAIIVAVDAGNLLPVAQVMRQRYPDAQIIIAADNDIKPGSQTQAKTAAEKAAKAVSGWVALPQSEKRLERFSPANGLEAATAAFNDSMYQPEGEKVVVNLRQLTAERINTKLLHLHLIRWG